MGFECGQWVLIKGSELDGVVGQVVSQDIRTDSYNLKTRLSGGGDALTNVRSEFLEAIPPDGKPTKFTSGEKVAFELDGRLTEGVVVETIVREKVKYGSALTYPAATYFVSTDEGRCFECYESIMRKAIEIPAFESVEEADSWSLDIVETMRSGE